MEVETSRAPAAGAQRRGAPGARIAAIVPALDEADSIATVVKGLRRQGVVRVIVVDNGSRDTTVMCAREAGAEVVHERRRGYGAACAAGVDFLARTGAPDLVVFADGDGSDVLEDLRCLVEAVTSGSAQLALGARRCGSLLPLHVRCGNRFALWLMRQCVGASYADLGPLRVVRWTVLRELGMRDRRYGWTAEMQARAALGGVRVVELPVRYRPRRRGSKISGTWRGSIRAGYDIVRAIVAVARAKSPARCVSA